MPRRRKPWVVVAARRLIALGLLLLAWPSQAEEPNRRVPVRIAPAGEHERAIREVLVELLGRLDVTAEVVGATAIDVDAALTPATPKAGVVASVWIDLTDGREARLYLADSKWERVLVRRLSLADRSEELLREELGHIVQTAVESLLVGAEVGAPRAQVRAELGLAPEPAPTAPPAPAAPKPVARPVQPTAAVAAEPAVAPTLPATIEPAWRIGGALFWEGQGYASRQVLVHGPGLRVGVDAPGITLGPGMHLTAAYRVPFDKSGDAAGFRLQSFAARLLARLHVFRHPQFVLSVGAGAGLDVLRLEPFLIDEGIASATPGRSRVAPLARVMLGTQLRLFGDTSLLLAMAGDIDIIGTRYVVQRGEELVPIVEPLRIRPTLQVGIATSLAGGILFPPP